MALTATQVYATVWKEIHCDIPYLEELALP